MRCTSLDPSLLEERGVLQGLEHGATPDVLGEVDISLQAIVECEVVDVTTLVGNGSYLIEVPHGVPRLHLCSDSEDSHPRQRLIVAHDAVMALGTVEAPFLPVMRPTMHVLLDPTGEVVDMANRVNVNVAVEVDPLAAIP